MKSDRQRQAYRAVVPPRVAASRSNYYPCCGLVSYAERARIYTLMDTGALRTPLNSLNFIGSTPRSNLRLISHRSSP